MGAEMNTFEKVESIITGRVKLPGDILLGKTY